MSYIIQITHNRGVSYWTGDLSGGRNGFGCLAKAYRYPTQDAAERELPDINVSYESVYYLGYLTASMMIKELSDEGQIIEHDTGTIRRYKR